MFDIDNHEMIMQMISAKHPDAYVIPLYVQLYRDRYSITELKQIKQFNPAGFRVGFGARVSIFDKRSFPSDKMFAYEIETVFSHFNENKNADEKFVVFSTTIVKEETPTEDEKSIFIPGKSAHVTNPEAFYNKKSVIHSAIDDQIEYYYNQLKDFLLKQYAEIKKQIIADEIAANTFSKE